MTPTRGKLAYPLAALAFLLSRLALRALGLSFNAEALDWYWQVLDPALLRGALLESLYHLHIQPPLFNLVIGLAAKIASDPSPILGGLWTVVGLALTLTLQAALGRLGWTTVPAAAIAVATSLSLPFIAYEHWLFYDFPCAALLAFGGYCLLRGAATRPGWTIAFAATVAALALTRSLFHLAWVLAAAALIVAAARENRRRAALVMLIPVALVAGLYLKNLVEFGFFGSSSWLGMSLTKMTVLRLSPEEREAMIVDGGRLSPLARLSPFGPVEDYGDLPPEKGVAALDRRRRSSGHPNFNHHAYLEVSRRRYLDARAVLAERPDVYLGAVGTAVRRFFTSTVRYPPFEQTLVRLEPWFRIHEATFGHPVFAVLGYAAALGAAGLALTRRRRARDPAPALAAGWVLLNLLWVLVVGCLLEVGENHRFRFTVSPLVWATILGAIGLRLRSAQDSTRV